MLFQVKDEITLCLVTDILFFTWNFFEKKRKEIRFYLINYVRKVIDIKRLSRAKSFHLKSAWFWERDRKGNGLESDQSPCEI